MLRALRQAAVDFFADECPMLAAAISYYAVFSLPPLLYALIATAGYITGERSAETAVLAGIRDSIGPGAAAQVYTMLHSVSDRESGSGLAAVLAGLALLFAATGVFVQVQTAINRAWNVQTEASAWKVFLWRRVLSFLVILGLSVLLVLSLALTAATTAVGDAAGAFVGEWFEPVVLAGNWVVGLAVTTFLFAAMFKWMPDAAVSWRDATPGAFVTALLFTAGNVLIGLYLGSSDVGERYGAAGALALIMVWVYFVSMVLLFGAELTHAWSKSESRNPGQ